MRLLAGLPAPQAEAWAPTLLTAHAELLPDWESADLIARARRTRHRRVWKRSRRALRTCSDFLAEEGGGVRRRGFAGTAPRALLQAAAQVEGSVPLAAGPRSATWRLGDTVWKHYPREGAWQSLRRQLGAGPGRAAYRHLAVLELLGLPASRPLAWLPGKQGEWLATPWVEGSPAALEDLIDMAHWLATLHRHGFGLRDAKCSNFRRDAAGVLTLIDADGLTRSCEDAARDLARLVAECPKDGPTTEAILKAYFVTSEQSRDEAFEARFQERLAVFRAKLAR
ncbi:MAG: hypothetical protein CMJ94_06095 [Planctomycetes bacterium]|nr:hypothetical protein [Planctomycetota bacterium]